MSQTTLTAAVNATARVVSIASTSGAVVGRCLALGSELTRITAVLTGACEVQRGTDGTSAAAHAQGTTVTINTPGSFVPSGALLPAFGPDGTVWTSEGPTVASAFETGGGGGGSPAAPSGSVQFNDGGSFGGDANLTWTTASKTLNLADEGIIGFGPNGLEFATISANTSAGNAISLMQSDGASLVLSNSTSSLTYVGDPFVLFASTTGKQWTFNADGMLAIPGTITRDGGDLTLSTTTSGKIRLNSATDDIDASGNNLTVDNIFDVASLNGPAATDMTVTSAQALTIQNQALATVVLGSDGGLTVQSGSGHALSLTAADDCIISTVGNLVVNGETGVTNPAVVGATATFHIQNGLIVGIS